MLVDLGFEQFRVRHHQDMARIEVPVDEFSKVLANHEAIVDSVRKAGYRFVTLDLAGFRSGSLNGAQAGNGASAIVPLSELTG